MDTFFFNGSYLPKDRIFISPDDRGFIFGDGVYEVIKWYAGFFFDEDGHLKRLRRSLRETRIEWKEADSYATICRTLINENKLTDKYAIVYLQVSRGAAPRTHSFPDPAVAPTIYGFARETAALKPEPGPGVGVLLKPDIRWSRCDIKSIALLANTLSFQEAWEQGMKECIFVRNGVITEGSRSNIFLVSKGTLYTHPESNFILSGITRNNILRFAREAGVPVCEEAFPGDRLDELQEAFISNTSAEVTPVSSIGNHTIGNGKAGPVTLRIFEKFMAELLARKG